MLLICYFVISNCLSCLVLVFLNLEFVVGFGFFVLRWFTLDAEMLVEMTCVRHFGRCGLGDVFAICFVWVWLGFTLFYLLPAYCCSLFDEVCCFELPILRVLWLQVGLLHLLLRFGWFTALLKF